jgi:hypothetical protein
MLHGGPTRALWRLAAVESWLAQRGVESELLVVSELPTLSPLPRVRWVPCEPGETIGEKRNRATLAAGGVLIAHWDDDDWSAPGRLAFQATAFSDPAVMICGFRSALFWDVGRRETWRYTGEGEYAIGSSLMYRRSWAIRNPFQNRQTGEDHQIVLAARRARSLRALDNPGLLTCRTHGGCVTRRSSPEGWHPDGASGRQWEPAAESDLPADFLR